VEFHVKGLSEGSEEVGDKLYTSVGGNVGWDSVLGEYMEYEE